MFERFTDRARHALALAQDEARLLQNGYISEEHLVLGLIDAPECLAAQTLRALGLSLEAVREAVLAGAQLGPREHEPPGPRFALPFTPRAKGVLEAALRECLQLGHQHIGTEHLLLGVLAEEDGSAAGVLTELGATLPAVRSEVVRQQQALGVPQGRRVGIPRANSRPVSEAPQSFVHAIDQLGRRPEDFQAAFSALGQWLVERGRRIEDLTSADLLIESSGDGETAGLRLSVSRTWLGTAGAG